MAVSWSKIIELAPQLALAFLPGIGAASRGGTGIVRAVSKGLPEGMGFEYPKMSQDFDYPVVDGRTTTSVDGKETKLPSLNSGLDLNAADAALAQDLATHNQAVRGGYEQTLAEWWPGEDIKPRKVINPSSSAVKGIKIAPDGTIQIQWFGKNAKWYTYRKGKDMRDSSRIVHDLITSPSIGRALVRKGRLAHKDSRDLTGKPVPDSNVGWWGRKYFDPTIGMGR